MTTRIKYKIPLMFGDFNKLTYEQYIHHRQLHKSNKVEANYTPCGQFCRSGSRLPTSHHTTSSTGDAHAAAAAAAATAANNGNGVAAQGACKKLMY